LKPLTIEGDLPEMTLTIEDRTAGGEDVAGSLVITDGADRPQRAAASFGGRIGSGRAALSFRDRLGRHIPNGDCR